MYNKKQKCNYTKLDLQGVKVLQLNNPKTVPTNIKSISKPFYEIYTIDPEGDLFGKTLCGLNNYKKYLVYNSI
jgi:hypothetical protein